MGAQMEAVSELSPQPIPAAAKITFWETDVHRSKNVSGPFEKMTVSMKLRHSCPDSWISTYVLSSRSRAGWPSEICPALSVSSL